jgi:RNA polymerase sigma-70 factor (ECF subfamily)
MKSILYIEDEPDYQFLVQRILEKTGCRLETALTAESGFLALQRAVPDLLILDVNLPDSDGFTFCRRVRQHAAGSGLPILMLTVRRRHEEWLRGFSCGATDYLSKPINPPELIERIQSAIETGTGVFKGPPEYQLTQAGASGNRAAFEVLVHQYKDRLVDSMRARVHSVPEAEDIAAAAFAKAYQRLDQFRGTSSFYTWLYRIAMNEWKRQLRSRRNVSLEGMCDRQGSSWSRRLTPALRVEEEACRRRGQSPLQRAVDRIPKPYRQIITGRFIKGLTYEKMARRFKIPAGTVMSRLFKAKRLLRNSWHAGR